jgi:HSP20 family protein
MADQKSPTPPSTPSVPFFGSMQREMNQWLDRFRPHPLAHSDSFFDRLAGPGFPALDVVETEDAIEITAEVPGVSEDDLDVSLAQNMLVLRGEKSSDHEEKEQDFHLVERRYGSFRRQVPLGFTPEDEAVSATFKDGVLKLRIAKPDEAKQTQRKIKISHA